MNNQSTFHDIPFDILWNVILEFIKIFHITNFVERFKDIRKSNRRPY